MTTAAAKFQIGQPIQHRRFGYRGVVFDVDPVFGGTEEWYAAMALSRPPKDRPWYHVLVHDAAHTTYVAERNLEPDDSDASIRHPLLDDVFTAYENGLYVPRRRAN